jgi:cytochrome P450
VVSTLLMHRRADLFPAPDAFELERFSPEREPLIPRYGYLPFGIGPRACIGAQLAMLETTLVLATALQRFVFELEDEGPVPVQMRVTLRPGRPIWARLRGRREGARG